MLGRLNLSSAFDVINRDLLYQRMDFMGLPPDIIGLIKDWLTDRMYFVETGGESSKIQPKLTKFGYNWDSIPTRSNARTCSCNE